MQLSRIYQFIFSVIIIFFSNHTFANSFLIEGNDGVLTAKSFDENSACPFVVFSGGMRDSNFYVIPADEISKITPGNPDTYNWNQWTFYKKDGSRIAGSFWLVLYSDNLKSSIEKQNDFRQNAPMWMPSEELSRVESLIAHKDETCQADMSFTMNGAAAGNLLFGNFISYKEVKQISFFDGNGAQMLVEKKKAEEKAWRKHLTLGSDTHCGMVVEIRQPLIKVQTAIGEKWFRLEQLKPPGSMSCNFLNGVYQDAE